MGPETGQGCVSIDAATVARDRLRTSIRQAPRRATRGKLRRPTIHGRQADSLAAARTEVLFQARPTFGTHAETFLSTHSPEGAFSGWKFVEPVPADRLGPPADLFRRKFDAGRFQKGVAALPETLEVDSRPAPSGRTDEVTVSRTGR